MTNDYRRAIFLTISDIANSWVGELSSQLLNHIHIGTYTLPPFF
jgi:hypothetical protein